MWCCKLILLQYFRKDSLRGSTVVEALARRSTTTGIKRRNENKWETEKEKLISKLPRSKLEAKKSQKHRNIGPLFKKELNLLKICKPNNDICWVLYKLLNSLVASAEARVSGLRSRNIDASQIFRPLKKMLTRASRKLQQRFSATINNVDAHVRLFPKTYFSHVTLSFAENLFILVSTTLPFSGATSIKRSTGDC